MSDIYDLLEKIDFIDEIEEENEGESAGLSSEEMEDIRKEFEKELDKNLEYMIKKYKNHLGHADMIDNEVKILNKKKKVSQNKAEKIKNFIDYVCIRSNIEKKTVGVFNIKYNKQRTGQFIQSNDFDFDRTNPNLIKIKKELVSNTEIERLIKEGLFHIKLDFLYEKSIVNGKERFYSTHLEYKEPGKNINIK